MDEKKICVADSGCQTCRAGPELLSTLKCFSAYLLKTKYWIVRITESPLDIIGSIFLNITVGKKSTKQLVYSSRNCRDFYLSRTALKDLESFPQSQSAAANVKELVNFNCPTRTRTLPRPAQIAFTQHLRTFLS